MEINLLEFFKVIDTKYGKILVTLHPVKNVFTLMLDMIFDSLDGGYFNGQATITYDNMQELQDAFDNIEIDKIEEIIEYQAKMIHGDQNDLLRYNLN